MAMGIYAGAGGVKTVSSIYVGAGGVKTVKAVYVGAGSVKQVWPSWSDGDSIFPIDTSYWNGYHVTETSHTLESANVSLYGYSGEYALEISWNVLRIENGAFFVSKETINASSINYLYFDFVICDSTSSHNAQFYAYCSVATSASSLISSDSGVGSYGSYKPTLITHMYYAKYIVADLRNCTRTGYLKFGVLQTANNVSGSTNTGQIYLYNAQVYSSNPSSSADSLTVT